MGLFSNSKKTVVGTAAMHIMDTDDIGNPIGDAVVEAVLTSGVPHASLQDIPNALLNVNLSGLSLKIDRAYEYARDHYKLGLPTGATIIPPTISSSGLAPYILTETGYPYQILVTDHTYVTFTPKIAIAAYLMNVREYDPITDSVGVWPPGTNYTQHWDEDLGQFTKRVGIDSVDVLADNITARITYQRHIFRPVIEYGWYEVEGGEGSNYNRYGSIIVTKWVLDGTVTEDVAIPGATISTIWNGDCLLALYKKYDAGGVLLPEYYSWIYYLDGSYPELHHDVTQDPATFLPVIPLRYENKDLTDPDTENDPPDPTNLYSTSTKLLKILGTELSFLGSKLNENPDLNKIDHAYLMFGVNIQTEFIPSIFYLTQYFYQLATNQRGSELSFLNSLADPTISDEPVNAVIYNPLGRWGLGPQGNDDNTFKEYGLALDIQFDYITATLTSEVIGTGETGYAEKTIVPHNVTIVHQDTSGGDSTHGGEPYETTQTRYKLVLKAQINSEQVRTVEVYNLQLVNWVYRRYNVVTTLEDVFKNEDENGLIIPIQYQFANFVFDDSQIKTRDSFYVDSMMLIVQAIDRITVKWYQKGLFKFIVTVVAIAVTWWMGGWGGVVVGALFSIAFRVFIKLFGHKLGATLFAIIQVIAIIVTQGRSLLSGATSWTMVTAQTILQISTVLVSTANEFLVIKGQEILNNYTDFIEKMSGLWEELEAVQDLLAMKADYDPLIFTKPAKYLILPSETPTVFFNRCLDLPDNTLYSIHDEIPNFIDMRLRHDKDISPDLYRLNS